MAKKLLLLIGLTIPLLSFAAESGNDRDLTPEDEAAIGQTIPPYLQCLKLNTDKFIQGSDDVELLVNHLISVCEHHLEKVANAATSRGLSTAFAEGLTKGLREEYKVQLTSLVLEAKAGK